MVDNSRRRNHETSKRRRRPNPNLGWFIPLAGLLTALVSFGDTLLKAITE
jgi:hypothetical protein